MWALSKHGFWFFCACLIWATGICYAVLQWPAEYLVEESTPEFVLPAIATEPLREHVFSQERQPASGYFWEDPVTQRVQGVIVLEPESDSEVPTEVDKETADEGNQLSLHGGD